MRITLTWANLPALFPSFAAEQRWLPLLQRHWDLLEAAAPRVSVTTVSSADAVQRHYAESLELLRILEEAATFTSLADVGSGGGFPGLVAAVIRPELHVHLIEPLQKRARLLEQLATTLALPNVTVHAIRAEEAGGSKLRDASAAVVARAVAPLAELLEYTAPLAAEGSIIALPKGSRLDEELALTKNAQSELGVEFARNEPMRAEVSDALRVMLFTKVRPTSARYPRRPGAPGKRPL